MTPEVLHGLLWRARGGLRLHGLALFAGHGVADPAFRPPRLPYASVIGPLNLETESDRDQPRAVFLWVRAPGYLAGARRGAVDVVPANGVLFLLVDADVQADLNIAFGALDGETLDNNDAGDAVAAVIQAAIRQAVDNGGFSTDAGPINESERLAELRRITARWDSAGGRLVISSGRRGSVADIDAAAQQSSQVRIRPQANQAANALAAVLGLDNPEAEVDGRLLRHRVPNPLAVAVDCRLDLWAGRQRDLAAAVDSWSGITPTRGQLLVRPALLLEDVADGAVSVRLQTLGESPGPGTLAQLEPELGFTERLRNRPLRLSGATIEPGALLFSGIDTADLLINPAPPVPDPWLFAHPGPNGYALTLGLRTEPGAVAGASRRIVVLSGGGRVSLRLELGYVNDGGELWAELRLSAQQADLQQAGVADFGESRTRLTPVQLQEGVELHLLVDSARGVTGLFVNGNAAAPVEGAPPLVAAPGTAVGDHDMSLTLGDAAGAPIDYRITHLQLHGRPIGPPDPRLRAAISSASDWSVGDPLTLVRSKDGVTPEGKPFVARVMSVNGDTLTLDTPVSGAWPRTGTLVGQRSLFFSQRQIRRRDDFMNRLYRITIEYRVSTFLDELIPGVSAPLVEHTELPIRELSRIQAEAADPENPNYPSRRAPRGPGVQSVIRSINSHTS